MEQKEIDPEDLIYLEEDLTKEELISILFLLYGSEKSEWILGKLKSGTRNLLQDFATHHTNWKTAVVQALTITQIFEVIENLGIESSEAREDLTKKLVINPGLKLLYQFCEACTKEPTKRLIQHIKSRCESAKASSAEQLEVYIIHLIASQVIKVPMSLDDCDFSFIVNFFNENKFSEVEKVLSTFPKKTSSLDNGSSRPFNTVNLSHPSTSLIGQYKSKRLFVLVINQQTFRKDSNPELKHLLPGHILNERKGTAQDKNKLRELFESFDYQVSVKDDQTHLEILREVENAANQAKKVDGLVVCILSHGQEGIVYGSNSIPVPIKWIKNKMASDHLVDKPKILFIQACQGESLQQSVRKVKSKNETDGELHEPDGPTQSAHSSGVKFADFLTFWSTIEGFASVRHIDNGSWFIQELVKKIRELHREQHLIDICTAVTYEVSQKRGYYDECMISKVEHTFTKNFRFPLAKPDSSA